MAVEAGTGLGGVRWPPTSTRWPLTTTPTCAGRQELRHPGSRRALLRSEALQHLPRGSTHLFLGRSHTGRSSRNGHRVHGHVREIARMGRGSGVATSTAQAAPPQLYWTADDGTTWSRATVGAGFAQYAESSWQLGAPTCSARLCLVVGGDTWYGTPGLALVSKDAGRSWSATELPRARRC